MLTRYISNKKDHAFIMLGAKPGEDFQHAAQRMVWDAYGMAIHLAANCKCQRHTEEFKTFTKYAEIIHRLKKDAEK